MSNTFFSVTPVGNPNGPGALFELPGEGGSAFIAETLLDDDTVRETEVIWSGVRADGLLLFAVYDEAGTLSAASRFATNGGGEVSSASPYTCLFCHGRRAGNDVIFDVVSPD